MRPHRNRLEKSSPYIPAPIRAGGGDPSMVTAARVIRHAERKDSRHPDGGRTPMRSMLVPVPSALERRVRSQDSTRLFQRRGGSPEVTAACAHTRSAASSPTARCVPASEASGCSRALKGSASRAGLKEAPSNRTLSALPRTWSNSMREAPQRSAQRTSSARQVHGSAAW